MRKSTPMAKLTENSGRVMPAPITHRNEFPTGYSLAGCSPAEPTSAFPADLILQPEIPFVMEFPANGNCRSTVCLKEGRSPILRLQQVCFARGETNLNTRRPA